MVGRSPCCYFNFAYSALACFRMGIRGSASFPEGEEIFITAASPLGLLQENNVKIEVTAQNTETLSIRRQVK